jgi:hypothetical protein
MGILLRGLSNGLLYGASQALAIMLVQVMLWATVRIWISGLSPSRA